MFYSRFKYVISYKLRIGKGLGKFYNGYPFHSLHLQLEHLFQALFSHQELSWL